MKNQIDKLFDKITLNNKLVLEFGQIDEIVDLNFWTKKKENNLVKYDNSIDSYNNDENIDDGNDDELDDEDIENDDEDYSDDDNDESNDENNEYIDAENQINENDDDEEGPKNIGANAKGALMRLILKDPKTYFVLAVVIAILFIIGLIIVLFPGTKTEPPLRILCGGPSKLDSIIVITTNESGDPIEQFDFYTYISHKVYSDISYYAQTEPLETYQAQAIATVSKVLSQQYHENILEANIEKYNNWCTETDKENLQINCMDNIGDNVEILIVESEMANQETCNSLTGCYHWENKGYKDLFGIKDGECINTYQSLFGNYLGSTIEKYCPVNVTLTEEKILELETDYDFKTEDNILYVLVKAESIFDEGYENDEGLEKIISFISGAVDSVRGVLMVHVDGSPALTEYYTLKNNNPACQELLTSPSPSENFMCSTIEAYNNENNIFNQSIVLNWPVHKILTYWYDYYFASWSESGRQACQLYSPKNDPRTLIVLNLDDKAVENKEIKKRPDSTKTTEEQIPPDLNYFEMDYGSSLLSTFAYLKNKRNQRLINEYEIPMEIKELTISDIEDDFNRHIRDAVKSKGIGTGPGVAMAAISLINYMEVENFRLPYTLTAGSYNEYGINPAWGKKFIDETSNWAEPALTAWRVHFPYITHTIPQGMDCSQFVSSSIKNGGVIMKPSFMSLAAKDNNDESRIISRRYNDEYWNLVGHSNVGWFGDPMWREAGGIFENPHGKLIIGVVFDINNVLVGNKVAESSGPWKGLHVSNISVRNGEPLHELKIQGGGSETEDPSIIGSIYTQSATDPDKPPYSIIDLSSCYNQTNPNLCKIDTDENFFKGKVVDKPEYTILEEIKK